MADSRIYTVTQLNQEIKNLLESNPSFFNLFVRGEISNYKAHPSGHHYMSLKDEGAAISAVLFRSDAMKLRFHLKNGMKVVARGRISSFPKSGQVQLYLADLMPDGVGALHMQYEQLKEKLYQEGLFDGSRKRPIPAYPERIALVTSPSGAAVQDMLRILNRRWPLAEVRIFPASVQGKTAPKELIAALQAANQQSGVDIIIIGRGGGSLEDLWAFNDEQLARAIYKSKIPVISAVGHEPDVTIADFVADLRAPTPSGGAELAVPHQAEVRQAIRLLDRRMQMALRHKLDRQQERMQLMQHRLDVQTPLRYLNLRRTEVQAKQTRLEQAIHALWQERNVAVDWATQQLAQRMTEQLHQRRQQLARDITLLDAYSPLKILSRGYAVAKDEYGKAITEIDQLYLGEEITLCLQDGMAKCQVQQMERQGTKQWQPERN